MDETPADRIRQATARYESGNGEAERLADAVIRRLAWRLEHGRKQCDRCREELPVASFSRDRSRPDGLRRYCRGCDAARRRPAV